MHSHELKVIQYVPFSKRIGRIYPMPRDCKASLVKKLIRYVVNPLSCDWGHS